MSRQYKQVKLLVSLLNKQGIQAVYDNRTKGCNHHIFKIATPKGYKKVFYSGTTSDRRSAQNFISHCKRISQTD